MSMIKGFFTFTFRILFLISKKYELEARSQGRRAQKASVGKKRSPKTPASFRKMRWAQRAPGHALRVTLLQSTRRIGALRSSLRPIHEDTTALWFLRASPLAPGLGIPNISR